MKTRQILTGRMQRNRSLKLVVLVGCLVLLFGTSAIVPDIMESRNLITAQEMVEDGHWIIPTMNGDLRLEKPPLPTWIAAVTLMTLGSGWWALRLVPTFMGVLMLVYFFLLARRMTGNERYACVASLIFCTCYNFALMAKTVSWDIYCHAFMMMGIYYLWRMLTESPHGFRHAVLAGLGLGLSFLSKGPVSLYALFLPFVLALIFHYRDKVTQHRRQLITVVILTLLVGVTWYAYILYFQQAASDATLQKESGSWFNRNTKPFYYYITFFTETGIWALLCITSLFYPYWKKRVADSRHYLSSLTWMLLVLVCLSVLPEKKNRYLLPILVPAALAMGHVLLCWIDRLRQGDRKFRRIFYVNACPLVLVMLVLTGACVFVACTTSVSLWLCAGLALFFILSLLLSWKAVKQLNAKAMLASVVVAFIGIASLGMPCFAHYLSNPDYTTPKQLLAADYPGVPAYFPAHEELRIELVYDMGRKVKLLDESQLAKQKKPFILLVTDASELDPALLTGAKVLGKFDANRQSRMSRMNRPNFYYTLYYFY